MSRNVINTRSSKIQIVKSTMALVFSFGANLYAMLKLGTLQMLCVGAETMT